MDEAEPPQVCPVRLMRFGFDMQELICHSIEVGLETPFTGGHATAEGASLIRIRVTIGPKGSTAE